MGSQLKRLIYTHEKVLGMDLSKCEIYMSFLDRLEKVIEALLKFNPKRALGKFYVSSMIGYCFINLKCEREYLGDKE